MVARKGIKVFVSYPQCRNTKHPRVYYNITGQDFCDERGLGNFKFPLFAESHFRSYFAKNTNRITRNVNKYQAKKIASRFCRLLSKAISEHRGGVYIKGLGYFFVYAPPMKVDKFLIRRKVIDWMPEYLPTFIPEKDTCMKFFVMDGFFKGDIGRGIRKRISEGQRYLNLSNLYLDVLEGQGYDLYTKKEDVI